MKHPVRNFGAILGAVLISVAAQQAFAHGDVVPQAVDTTGLKNVGPDFLASNPYRKDKTAIRIGDSAYNQNCARCHGLDALAITSADQSRNINRAHPCPRLVSEGIEER